MKNSKKARFLLLTTLLFLCISSLAQLSGNYTIDSNYVTGARNFQSFSDFTSTLSNQGVSSSVNVTVVPGSGPYNEQVIFTPYVGASLLNRVTIKGNGEVINFNPGSGIIDHRIVGFNDSVKYITLDSLFITGNKGVGVAFNNGADFNIVRNCTIQINDGYLPNNSGGIIIGECDKVSIAACPWGANASNIIIENNTILGTANTGPKFGIKLLASNTSGNGKNNTISNNTIKGFTYTGIHIENQDSLQLSRNTITRAPFENNYYTYGIYVKSDSAVSKVLIEKNSISSINSNHPLNTHYPVHGFYIDAAGTSTSPIKVENNLIFDLKNTNDTVYGVYSNNCQYIDYYHNTVYIKDTRVTSSYKYGFYLGGSSSNINLKNNIIEFDAKNTGENFAFNFNGTLTSIDCNFNNIYLQSTQNNNYFGKINSTKYKSLSNWRTASAGTFGTNSLISNPLFISDSILFARSSTINNVGENVNVVEDFNNVIRNTPPDFGAFEFDCGLPPNLQVKQLDDSTAIVSWDSLNNNITKWELLYNKFAFTPNDSQSKIALNAINKHQLTLQPLELNETYYYYLRKICGVGDTSLWSDQHSFLKTDPVLRGNYTINSTLPTAQNNFNSFKDFTDRLENAGIADTVIVDVVPGTGPYHEKVIFKNIIGQSRLNPIVINGNNEVISHRPNYYDRRVIGFENAKHITLNNLNIRVDSSRFGYGVHFLDKSDSNTVKNCNITLEYYRANLHPDYIGIYASTSIWEYIPDYVTKQTASNLKILNNVISSGKDSSMIIGICLVGKKTSFNSEVSRNSIIQGNLVNGFIEKGISLNFQENTEVTGNQISSIHNSKNNRLSGIYIDGSNDMNINIEKNEIFNIGANDYVKGIHLTSENSYNSSKVNIVNNIIHSLKANNSISGIEINGVREVNVYHNTFSINDSSTNSTVIRGVATYDDNASPYYLDLRNNIFSIISGGSGKKEFLRVYISTNNDGLKSDNNNYYFGDIGSNKQFGTSYNTYNTKKYDDVNEWLNQNLNKYDSSSLNINPHFISTSNYTPLNTGLSAIGAMLGVMDDFYGNSRDTIPDLGAINLSRSYYPYYAISTITSKDSNNVVDSLGVFCRTTGITYGVNLKENTGLDFYLFDENQVGQSSIRVTSNFNVSNYQFSEGDSIEVKGLVHQIQGQPYFIVSSVNKLGDNSKNLSSQLVDKPDDNSEGRIIELKDIKLIDNNQLNTYELRALNTQGDTILIQVEQATDVNDSLNKVGFSPNDSICSIIGVCFQKEMANQSLDYRILPMRFSDIDTISCVHTAFDEVEKDTIQLSLRNCIDSNYFSYQFVNQYNSSLRWDIHSTNDTIKDHFDFGLKSFWEDTLGVDFNNRCGTVNSSTSLTFNGNTNKRFIESYPLNLSCKSAIKLSVNRGGSCSNFNPTNNQNLKVQYSDDLGVSWRTIFAIKSSGNFNVNLPEQAKENLIKLRFIQFNSSGQTKEVWLIDNFEVENTTVGCNQNLTILHSSGTLDSNEANTIAGSINLDELIKGSNYYPIPIYAKTSAGNAVKYLVAEIDYKNNFCINFDYNSLSCGSSYQFTNLSSGEDLFYEWSFEGSTKIDTTKNPVHFFGADGIKTVTLKVCDQFSCDSISKTIHINNNIGPSEPACVPVNPNQYFRSSQYGVSVVELVDITLRDTVKYYYNDYDSLLNLGSANLSCNIRFHLNKDHYYNMEYKGSRVGTSNRLSFFSWIDFNNDNFLDSNERILVDHYGTYGNERFYIPDSAVLNTPLRMRLILVITSDDNDTPLPNVVDCNSNIVNRYVRDHFIRDHTVIITYSSGFAKPTSNFQYYQDKCFNEISFESTTMNNPTSYLWDFGDGQSSTKASVKHTFADTGSYQVQLITANKYGADTVTKTVRIQKIEDQISVVGDLLISCPLQFELQNDSNILHSIWDFGNTKTNSGSIVYNKYSSAGDFEVSLTTIDSNYCVLNYKDTITIEEYIDTIVACGQYTWRDGNTYFNSNQSATYVFGSNVNGCDSIVRLNLTINNVDTSLNKSGQTLEVNNPPGSTFQWLQCDGKNHSIIPNETTSIYTPKNDGFFACEITTNNCIDTTRCEYIVHPIKSNKAFILFPNPTLGNITIESTNSTHLDEIMISSSYGQVVYQKTGFASKMHQINTAGWQQGIYTVTVIIGGNVSASKMVVL